MSKETELKACPFCGGEAEMQESNCYSNGLYNDVRYYVGCTNQDCIIYYSTDYYSDTKAEAVAAWNHRPADVKESLTSDSDADLSKRLAEAEKQNVGLREALENWGEVEKALGRDRCCDECDEELNELHEESIERAVQALEHKGDGSCEWTYEINPDEMAGYLTGCSGCWLLVEGDIEENQMKFCPYCGKPITLPAEKGGNNKTKSP
jgi:hypothetical protein